jgi:hypothetical protein
MLSLSIDVSYTTYVREKMERKIQLKGVGL